MSNVKGQLREIKEFEKYVGFAKVNVVAINPDRDELNVLFDKEGDDTQKPIEYVGTDNDGNDKVRITFWLKDEKTGKLFPHNISLINKDRMDEKGIKNQYINNVLETGWAVDEDKENELPDFFTNFLDKDENIIGDKIYRKAKVGEEELGTFVRAWFGKLNFKLAGAEINITTEKLFAGDYSDLRSLMTEPAVAPFVILLGVRTDPDDVDKQYQQVFQKAYMPGGFIKYVNNGMKFSTTFAQNVWKSFQKKLEDKEHNGKYGFKAYYELKPLAAYDRAKDIAVGGKNEEREAVTDSNDGY